MPPSHKSPKTHRYWKSLQLQEGRIVSAYDNSPWTIGEWREVPAPERECEGLNCCENIIDAMGYVNMEVLAEVEIDGTRINGDDKITAQRMRIVRAWKWEKKDSVAMAVYAAELCLEYFERVYPGDKRPREAIEATKKWILDPTEENESAAWSAESAAWSAAWSAARSAESAAWSARSARSAESAAWSARSARSARSAESARSAAGAAWSAWSAAGAAGAAAKKASENMKKEIHRWIVKRTVELEVI